MPANAAPKAGDSYLVFNGHTTRVDIASRPEYGPPGLTVSAWIRRDVEDFPHFEQNHYVHWIGKGESGKHEWACRMYGQHTESDDPRPNRISFYVFNPGGGRGTGSYAQDPIRMNPPEWIHVVAVADEACTHFFKNGVFRDCDVYRRGGAERCTRQACDRSRDYVVPMAGDAPLRIGTRDMRSHFLGGIARVRLWRRVLSEGEIRALYERDAVPRSGLVAEFLLNEGRGETAVDGSPLRNDGVIMDGAWAVEG